jgi:hypothetical protein
MTPTKLARYAALLLLLHTTAPAMAQPVIYDSIVARFAHQMMLFPQEKIYAHIDKPLYVAGEDVWFRAYLTDAMSHVPDTTSLYVYAELVAPDNTVMQRVKVRPTAGGYYGRIPLASNLPAGQYMLRFYTLYLQSMGDPWFFKRSITVCSPDPDRAGLPHSLPDNTNDYDVAFFAEGGNFPAGAFCNVAFKALNARGWGERITGVVVNAAGDTLAQLKTAHRGMGSFALQAKEGEQYRAICTDSKGLQKTFDLPAPDPNSVSLKVSRRGGLLYVSLTSSPGFTSATPLYLAVQCRGNVGTVLPWNTAKGMVALPQKDLPSGLIQLLLIDENLSVLSERLVFNINPQESTTLHFATHRPAYQQRDSIALSVAVADADGAPVTGTFSISVTDDNDLQPDTTTSILASMLLASDLKGYVESPNDYFTSQSATTAFALDALLMTQGWKRYRVDSLLQGHYELPSTRVEVGNFISGMLKGGLMMNKTVEGYPVSLCVDDPMVAFSLLMFKKATGYPKKVVLQKDRNVQITLTDSLGRFIFWLPEFPDSTGFLLRGDNPNGSSHVELSVDSIAYPAATFSVPRENASEDAYKALIKKIVAQYKLQGIDLVQLDEVVVTAARPEKKGKSVYSSPFNTKVSTADMEKQNVHDMMMMLRMTHGVTVLGNNITIQGSSGEPLVLLDGVEVDIEMIKEMPIEVVDEVEIVKSAQAALFGSRGGNGIILVTTMSGFDQRLNRAQRFNMQLVEPLGYQQPKEFYAPRYATVEQRLSTTPDLRTTLYWNPCVSLSDKGSASLSFYAADSPQSYSVVIEGITDNGKLIHAVRQVKGGK